MMARVCLEKRPACKICIQNRAISGNAAFMIEAGRQICSKFQRIDNSKSPLGRPAFVASLTAFSSGSKRGSNAMVKALSMIRPFIWVPKSAFHVSLRNGPVDC